MNLSYLITVILLTAAIPIITIRNYGTFFIENRPNDENRLFFKIVVIFITIFFWSISITMTVRLIEYTNAYYFQQK